MTTPVTAFVTAGLAALLVLGSAPREPRSRAHPASRVATATTNPGAQRTSAEPRSRTVATHRLGASPFPDGWLGEWTGTLVTLAPPDSVRNRIPISLTIAHEDTGSALTWRTIFNADTVRGLRDYRLVVRDRARGQYATDERNGLLLDETYIDGTLVSVFEVGGRVLESRYVLRGDTLTHDITWWSTTPSATTRGQGANSEAGATVRSFRVEGRQHARFTRTPAATR